MKRAFVGFVLLAGAFFGYRHFAASGPVKLYEEFAEEMLHRRYDAAAALTDGLTKSELEPLGTQERVGGGPPMFQTLFPSRFKILSEDRDGDTATVTAMQTIYFNPVGVESAVRPAMFAELKQVATLKKTDAGWRVGKFANEFVKMDEVKNR